MKTSVASHPAADRAVSNRLPFTFLSLYTVVWVVTAISPSDRKDWLLENLLVFVAVPGLVLTYRRFRFSTGAYALLTLFFVLHAYGAHYTYAETPLGNWVRDTWGHSRNHFDRAVHFLFGVCVSPALGDLLRRGIGLRRGWAYAGTVHVVLAWSAVYEIIEAVVAMLVSPELGAAYNGTQGDPWDAQKDAALAGVGSAIAVAILAALRWQHDSTEHASSSADRNSA